MSPTPEPTIVLNQIVSSGDSAPWWGVPAIAAAALLVGGFLTYLYARHTERTKADRAQKEKLDEDILTSGLEMLAAGERIRKLGLLTLRRRPSESVLLVTEQGMGLIDGITDAGRRFNITMPQEFQADFDGYLLWSLMLMSPPYQRPGQELALNNQVKFERSLVTRLRAMRKLTPLVFPGQAEFGTLRPEEMLADAFASDIDAERQMDEANKKSGPSGGRSFG